MSLFDDVTPESIKEDFFANYEGHLDTREGSFLDLLISPFSWVLYKGYMDLKSVLSILFPDETSGHYLDADGVKYGIVRRAGTAATAAITFTGTDGLTIPAGTSFLTEDGRVYLLMETVILADGAGQGLLQALETGVEYNASANTISRMYSALPGLSSFSVGEASGGTDPESSLSLYNRINYYRQNPSSSGNSADYYNWATSVEGVGTAYVIPKQFGPGTVGVIISGPDGGSVDSRVVTAVKDYIETQRPVGATVSVASCTEQQVNVSVRITHEENTDLQEIKSAFTDALAEYLTGVGIFGGTLSYNRVAYLLLSISGVIDFSELTVNGGTAAVTLAPGVAAVVGAVDIREVEE